MFDLVALDADDTLWHNEPLYRTARDRFCALLGDEYAPELIDDRLYETERRNLEHFGYGVKGFVLSLIETGIDLTGGRMTAREIQKIIDWGREMLASPVELLDGVRDAVEALSGEFPLILVTKGDLFHQESKLARSGLGHLFRGVEIVTEKDADTYRRVMSRYRVPPERFVMVGNSLRSDVLPVLQAGAHAVHVPYEISWIHERVAPDALADAHFHEVAHIRDVSALLHRLAREGGAS
jgi:putative hydrolase of the HAD superfamily